MTFLIANKDLGFLGPKGWRKQPALARFYGNHADAAKAAKAAAIAFSVVTVVVDAANPPAWLKLNERHLVSLKVIAERGRIQAELKGMGHNGPHRWGY